MIWQEEASAEDSKLTSDEVCHEKDHVEDFILEEELAKSVAVGVEASWIWAIFFPGNYLGVRAALRKAGTVVFGLAAEFLDVFGWNCP